MKEAIGAIKDIVKGDADSKIVKLYEDQIKNYQGILLQKDELIKSGAERERNKDIVIADLRTVSSDWKAQYKAKDKQLVRAVRWGRWKVVFIPIVGAAGFYLGNKIFK